MQLTPKPLEPQLDFSALSVPPHVLKLQQCQWHVVPSQKPLCCSTILISYRTSNWCALTYACPFMKKELIAFSLAHYCSDANGGTRYILHRGCLKT